METKNILRIIIILSILIVNVGCDRVTKVIVRESLNYNESISYLNNHLTLTKVENTGAFLSLGNNLPEFLRVSVLIVFPVLALILALLFLLFKKGLSKWTLTGLAFVIGGGIGNLYDRIVFGSVTDFLHINFVAFQTGIFNMADVSIMVGMFLILMQAFTQKTTNQLLTK